MLDLGSGGGIDVILSAKRVGETGLAFGLDMTDEMLALARANAQEAGIRNAVFLKGVIEEIPLPADSVDVVISNCVINLSTDKPAVLTEIARVLRPGGRIGISDVVAEDRLSAEERAERGSYVGCIAGALSKSEYEAGLEAAGFDEISVEFTHEVADGMHGAIVKAVKTAEPERRGLPVDRSRPRARAAAEARTPRQARGRSAAAASASAAPRTPIAAIAPASTKTIASPAGSRVTTSIGAPTSAGARDRHHPGDEDVAGDAPAHRREPPRRARAHDAARRSCASSRPGSRSGPS